MIYPVYAVYRSQEVIGQWLLAVIYYSAYHSKKKMNKLLFIVALLFGLSANGQQYVLRQSVQSIVHKIIIPEDGSLEEALALTREWTESVLRKNENIDDVQLLLSSTDSDTLDLMVLYKFREDVVRSTNEINQELIKKRWPGEKDFENFLKQLHAYIDPKMNEKSIFRELVLE